MEDLVLTWGDETGEEFALTCSYSARGLQVDAQQRMDGKVVRLSVPEDVVEDLVEWFAQLNKLRLGRMF